MNIESCRLSRCGKTIQFVAVIFCAFNMMNSGMEYGWTSAAFPHLLKPGKNLEPLITSKQGIWIATLPLVGAIFGTSLTGFSWDIIGRKSIIIISTMTYTVHWILIGLSKGASMLYVARFFAGFSTGLALSAIPTYTAEIADAKLRGRLCAVGPMCIVAGVFLINLLSLFLDLNQTAFVVLIFPILSFIGMIFMPASPYFYLERKKEEQALKVLRIFSGKEDVDDDFQRIKQAVEEQREKKHEVLKSLLLVKTNRRCFCIVLVLRAAQPLSGITTLVYYSSVIFEQNDSPLAVEYATLIFCIAFLIAVFIGLMLIDYLGRRCLILFSLAGSFVGLLLLGAFLNMKESTHDLSSYSFMPLLALTIIVSFFGIGLQQVPYVVQGELLSAEVKAVTVAVGLIVFCVFSIVCSKYFQLMNDAKKPYIPIYTYAIFAAATFVFCFFCMPETKGLSLEDVQLMMNQRKLHFEDVEVPRNSNT